MTMKTNDNGIDRDMTEVEETAHNATLVEIAKETKAQAKAQADKVAARQAVLDKLGLTADEVTALLG